MCAEVTLELRTCVAALLPYFAHWLAPALQSKVLGVRWASLLPCSRCKWPSPRKWSWGNRWRAAACRRVLQAKGLEPVIQRGGDTHLAEFCRSSRLCCAPEHASHAAACKALLPIPAMGALLLFTARTVLQVVASCKWLQVDPQLLLV